MNISEPLWLKDRLTSIEQLRSNIEEPHEAIIMKTVNVLESHIINYLSLSSLFFLATSNAMSKTDVSPRGDKAGFVKVLDEKHLAFPDRPGNRRTDSLLNIIENPQIGMIFVIPSLDEVLRINGRAIVTSNSEFIESKQWDGKTTGLAVVVEVEECFIHCPRAFKQGGLWDSNNWITAEEKPNVNEMFKAHLLLSGYSKT